MVIWQHLYCIGTQFDRDYHSHFMSLFGRGRATEVVRGRKTDVVFNSPLIMSTDVQILFHRPNPILSKTYLDQFLTQNSCFGNLICYQKMRSVWLFSKIVLKSSFFKILSENCFLMFYNTEFI